MIRIKILEDKRLAIVTTIAGLITIISTIIGIYRYYEATILSLSALLNIILIIIIIYLINKNNNMSKYVISFDREYILFSTKWVYRTNENDTSMLDATYLGEREIKCIYGKIDKISLLFSRDEAVSPFDPSNKYTYVIHSSSRMINKEISGGTVSFGEPYRTRGGSFGLEIQFNPPLIKGEELHINFEIFFPRYTVAFLEDLKSKTMSSSLELREYDFNSVRVGFPMKKLVYEIKFPNGYKIKPRELEVKRRSYDQIEERDYVLENNNYKAVELNGAWMLKLEREDPPLHVRYKLKWLPPSRES